MTNFKRLLEQVLNEEEQYYISKGLRNSFLIMLNSGDQTGANQLEFGRTSWRLFHSEKEAEDYIKQLKNPKSTLWGAGPNKAKISDSTLKTIKKLRVVKG